MAPYLFHLRSGVSVQFASAAREHGDQVISQRRSPLDIPQTIARYRLFGYDDVDTLSNCDRRKAPSVTLPADAQQ